MSYVCVLSWYNVPRLAQLCGSHYGALGQLTPSVLSCILCASVHTLYFGAYSVLLCLLCTSVHTLVILCTFVLTLYF